MPEYPILAPTFMNTSDDLIASPPMISSPGGAPSSSGGGDFMKGLMGGIGTAGLIGSAFTDNNFMEKLLPHVMRQGQQQDLIDRQSEQRSGSIKDYMAIEKALQDSLTESGMDYSSAAFGFSQRYRQIPFTDPQAARAGVEVLKQLKNKGIEEQKAKTLQTNIEKGMGTLPNRVTATPQQLIGVLTGAGMSYLDAIKVVPHLIQQMKTFQHEGLLTQINENTGETFLRGGATNVKPGDQLTTFGPNEQGQIVGTPIPGGSRPKPADLTSDEQQAARYLGIDTERLKMDLVSDDPILRNQAMQTAKEAGLERLIQTGPRMTPEQGIIESQQVPPNRRVPGGIISRLPQGNYLKPVEGAPLGSTRTSPQGNLVDEYDNPILTPGSAGEIGRQAQQQGIERGAYSGYKGEQLKLGEKRGTALGVLFPDASSRIYDTSTGRIAPHLKQDSLESGKAIILSPEESKSYKTLAGVESSLNALEDVTRKLFTTNPKATVFNAAKLYFQSKTGYNKPRELAILDSLEGTLGQQLAVAIQGARPSDADVKAIQFSFPSYNDTVDNALAKIGTIRRLIKTSRDGYMGRVEGILTKDDLLPDTDYINKSPSIPKAIKKGKSTFEVEGY